MKKSITAIALALIVLLLMIPTMASAATSGSYEYTDNGDGTCTITKYLGPGGGAITIPSTLEGLSVSRIGERTFYYGSNITSITIPGSVKTISSSAFKWLGGLRRVSIQEGVTTIEAQAFAFCESLTRVYIPSSVTTIGDEALYFCYPTICGESGSAAESYAEQNDILFQESVLGTIMTPDGIVFDKDVATVIDYTADNKNVVIPNSIDGIDVVYIGDNAFKTSRIESVDLPNTLISINENSFADCRLTSINIPDNVTIIGDQAFRDNILTSVNFGNGNVDIGAGAFRYNNLTSIDLSHVAAVGDSAFSYNRIENVTIPADIPVGSLAFSFNKEMTSARFLGSDVVVSCRLFWENENLTSVVFENGVTEVESGAFEECGLTSIELQGNNIIIGYRAFASNDLTSVTIDGVTKSIEEMAFYDNALEDITITGVDLEIGPNAFALNNLSVVSLNGSIQSIKEKAFYNNSITNLTILGNELNIGKEAFAENNINELNLVGNVKTIGEKAFYNNAVTSVALHGDNITIGSNAFANNNLTAASFEGSVNIIGEKAFFNNSLTGLTLPCNDTTIGKQGFAINTISNVSFEGDIKTIGEKAFFNNGITSLTFSGDVDTIETAAFSSNAITSINGQASDGIIFKRMSNGGEDMSSIVGYGGAGKHIDFIPSTVKTIEPYAFYDNAILSVSLPSSVDHIAKHAFSNNALVLFRLPAGTGDWADGNGNKYKGGDNVSDLTTYYTNVSTTPIVNIDSEWKYVSNGGNSHPITVNYSHMGKVSAYITNDKKQIIETLVSNQAVDSIEPLEVSWDGRTRNNGYSSGIYYIYVKNTSPFGKTGYQYKKLTLVDNSKPTFTMKDTYVRTSNNKHELTIDVKFDGVVEVRVVRMDGFPVYSVKNNMTKGTNTYYLEGEDKSGNRLNSGLYKVIVLEYNDEGDRWYTWKRLNFKHVKTPTLISDASFTKKSTEQHLIRFANSDDCKVTVAIKDTRKKTIRNIVYKADSSAGWHNLYWDGTDNDGNMVKSGSYYIYVIRYDSNGKYYYTRQKLTVNIPTAPTVSFDSRYTKTGSNTHLIKLSINEESKVTVAVRDAKKRTVRNIEYKNSFAAGEHSVYWDGKDNRGNVVKQGTYYIYVIRYDNNGKYHYVRKKLTFTPFKYPTIYSNSYYTRTGSNTHQIKVDIATDAKVSTCIKDANFKTVLYLEYKVHHEDGRFYLSWDGKDKNGNDVPNGTYYIYAIKYNEDGTYKWRRKKLTLN